MHTTSESLPLPLSLQPAPTQHTHVAVLSLSVKHALCGCAAVCCVQFKVLHKLVHWHKPEGLLGQFPLEIRGPAPVQARPHDP